MAVISSKQDGNWSATTTWEGGTLPSDGDEVIIKHHVTVDVEETALFSKIQVYKDDTYSGWLDFRTDGNSQLKSTIWEIQTGAKLTCGTSSNPLSSSYMCKIILEGNASTPAKMEINGDVELYGETKTAFLKLGSDASAGDGTITLESTPVNWSEGDSLVICQTERNDTPQVENRTIDSITNATVTLNSSLTYNHKGSGNFRADVGNLSRNIIIENGSTSNDAYIKVYNNFKAKGMEIRNLRGDSYCLENYGTVDWENVTFHNFWNKAINCDGSSYTIKLKDVIIAFAENTSDKVLYIERASTEIDGLLFALNNFDSECAFIGWLESPFTIKRLRISGCRGFSLSYPETTDFSSIIEDIEGYGTTPYESVFTLGGWQENIRIRNIKIWNTNGLRMGEEGRAILIENGEFRGCKYYGIAPCSDADRVSILKLKSVRIASLDDNTHSHGIRIERGWQFIEFDNVIIEDSTSADIYITMSDDDSYIRIIGRGQLKSGVKILDDSTETGKNPLTRIEIKSGKYGVIWTHFGMIDIDNSVYKTEPPSIKIDAYDTTTPIEYYRDIPVEESTSITVSGYIRKNVQGGFTNLPKVYLLDEDNLILGSYTMSDSLDTWESFSLSSGTVTEDKVLRLLVKVWKSSNGTTTVYLDDLEVS